MNKWINGIFIALLISCTNDQSPNTITETTGEESILTETEATSKININEEYLGIYISKPYLDYLNKTGSTKDAQEFAEMSTLKIQKADHTIKCYVSWNFHEGSPEMELEMITTDKGNIFTPPNETVSYEIDFSENGIAIIHSEYTVYQLVKANDQSDSHSYTPLINRSVFTNQFYLDSQQVDFKENGDLIGIEEFNRYELHQDYYDVGNEFDKIYLYDSNGNESVFGYEMTPTAFTIFELDCTEEDSEGYCMVFSRGLTRFEFQRKS